MKYGYSYSKLNEEMKKGFPKDIDKFFSDREFDKMLENVQKNDRLYVNSITQVAKDHEGLILRLHQLQDKSISCLYQGQQQLPIKEFLEFYEFVENSKRLQMRKHQQMGIEKALEKKSQGEGSYGRPKVEMPDDFEENVILVMKKKKTHAEYMKQSGLKRATYFKLLRQLRDGWKEHELESYLQQKDEN